MMLPRSSFSYCTVRIWYKFLVLSAGTIISVEFLILRMSICSISWNGSDTFLNSIFSISRTISSSKGFNSSIWGGHFLLLNPKFLASSRSSDSPPFPSRRKKKARHRIRFSTLSTFSINAFRYAFAVGIGMFFKEYPSVTRFKSSIAKGRLQCSTERSRIIQVSRIPRLRQCSTPLRLGRQCFRTVQQKGQIVDRVTT